jgi:hypothetical protein
VKGGVSDLLRGENHAHTLHEAGLKVNPRPHGVGRRATGQHPPL